MCITQYYKNACDDFAKHGKEFNDLHGKFDRKKALMYRQELQSPTRISNHKMYVSIHIKFNITPRA